MQRPLRTRGYRLELTPVVQAHRLGQGRTHHHGCSHLHGSIHLPAIWRALLSNDLDASTASTSVLANDTPSGHQDERKVAGTLGIHRGLTAHEEPASLAKVFADEE